MIAVLFFWLGILTFYLGNKLMQDSFTDLGEFLSLAIMIAGMALVTYSLFGGL